MGYHFLYTKLALDGFPGAPSSLVLSPVAFLSLDISPQFVHHFYVLPEAFSHVQDHRGHVSHSFLEGVNEST